MAKTLLEIVEEIKQHIPISIVIRLQSIEKKTMVC